MNYQTQKPKRVTGPTTLEILVFQSGGQWFGVRSGRQIHLLGFGPDRFKPAEADARVEGGPAGYLTIAKNTFPVYNLAFLLGLKDTPTLPEEGQLIQAAIEDQMVGFAIEEAQEIQRVPVPELRQIPAIVNPSEVAPVTWAVWLRPDNTIIPLLDLAYLPGF